MLNTKLLILILPALLLGACTVTGPADDGFENSNEWVDSGRLLSDDNSGYAVYRSENKQSSGSATSTDANSPTSDELEYATYKQWLDAKEKNSSEYQKFKQWQEFEDFHRWKEQQKTE